MTTVGEALVAGLAARGVEVVFGIPGVHTIELYRGLAGSGIRHVTPRHEQAAGFMADGYARVSGRPGVAFVITGPGLTNTLTAMAQARADSIPMLVVSGAGASASLGRGLGNLHELPDQHALAAQVALRSFHIGDPAELAPALDAAFDLLTGGRPGPVHIELPIDVMPRDCALPGPARAARAAPAPDAALLLAGLARLRAASAPVILAGGGARHAGRALAEVAAALDAPVVTTVNARGLLHGHPLLVPASPSLAAVRALIADADLVLALGTELGQTDYDVYASGGLPDLSAMIRVDIDAAQLARHPCATPIRGDAGAVLAAWRPSLAPTSRGGAARAAAARAAAWAEIGPKMQDAVGVLETIRDALPGAILVGNSTQPVYAGNLYHDPDRPCGWFNAATGYGALGYAPGAAIGAAIADPGAPVVCLVGDGGIQFALGDLGTAAEEGAGVIFLVWNNHGYREIAEAMDAAGVARLGVTPAPPAFDAIARAYGLPFERPDSRAALAAALRAAHAAGGPALIEWRV